MLTTYICSIHYGHYVLNFPDEKDEIIWSQKSSIHLMQKTYCQETSHPVNTTHQRVQSYIIHIYVLYSYQWHKPQNHCRTTA